MTFLQLIGIIGAFTIFVLISWWCINHDCSNDYNGKDAEQSKKFNSFNMIQTGKGPLVQINEILPIKYTITKENIRESLMSISDESFETLWKKTFGETYEEFINKMLENEL